MTKIEEKYPVGSIWREYVSDDGTYDVIVRGHWGGCIALIEFDDSSKDVLDLNELKEYTKVLDRHDWV